MVSSLTLVTTQLVAGTHDSFVFTSGGDLLGYQVSGAAAYTLWNTGSGSNGASITPNVSGSVTLLADNDELLFAQNTGSGNEAIARGGVAGGVSSYSASNSTAWVSTDSNGNFVYGYNGSGMYRVNMSTGQQTTIASSLASGVAKDPHISGDGNIVAFTNVVSGNVEGVYTRNLTTNQTSEIFSGSANWSAGDISQNGRYVMLYRHDGAASAVDTVHRYDTQTGNTLIVTATSLGATIGDVTQADMSADGRFIAFMSASGSVVGGDSNAQQDVFIKDLSTGNITRASVTSSGAQSSGHVLSFDLSEDGRYLSFVTSDNALTSTSGSISSGNNGSLYVTNNIYYGTAEGDYPIPDTSSTTINGNSGGNDTITGGTNGETINLGGTGNTVDGGGGNDVITSGGSSSGGGGSSGGGSGGGGGIIILPPGTRGDNLFGGAGNDTITGGTADDTLNGGMGNDVVYGSDGQDIVRGGKDNDFVQGNAGNDSVYGDFANDTVRGGKGGDTTYGGKGADFVYGDFDNDVVFGDLDNDAVFGGQGNDAVHGNAGNDTISGDKGDDLLYGEDGNDIFVFNFNSGVDNIQDFTKGDILQIARNLNNSGINGFSDLTARMSESFGATTIDFGEGNMVTLTGRSIASLASSDFQFV